MREERAVIRMDEQLSAYLDGELDSSERARLEARLAADPVLRERLDMLRQTVTLVSALPQASIPRNFILTPAMVAPARSRPIGPRWLAPALSFATAVSSVMLAVVVLTGLLGAPLGLATLTTRQADEVAMVAVEGTPFLMMEAIEADEEMALERAGPDLPPQAPGVVESPVEDPELTAAGQAEEAYEEAPVPPEDVPLPAPEDDVWGEVEQAPLDELALDRSHDGAAVARLSMGTARLLFGGLVVLTLVLGAATVIAWRARR